MSTPSRSCLLVLAGALAGAVAGGCGRGPGPAPPPVADDGAVGVARDAGDASDGAAAPVAAGEAAVAAGPPAGGPPATTAPAAARPLDLMTDDELALLTTLPPFDGAAAARPLPAAARRALEQALMEVAIGGADESAVRSALEVIALAPSSAPARLALACAVAQLEGDVEAAAILRTLRDAGCAPCLDALVNVTVAADQDPCRFGARSRAVGEGVVPSPLRVAATTILASLDSGDVAAVAPYLDPARPVVLAAACSVCDRPRVDTRRLSRARFQAFVRAAERRRAEGPTSYNPPQLLFCDARCCGGPTGMLSHTQVFVTDVCFHPGKRPRLARIDAVDGG